MAATLGVQAGRVAAPPAPQPARAPTLHDVPQREPNATELEHFRLHPENAGMATDDNAVILNPFSTLKPEQKEAVLLNERARVHMRRSGARPTFALTPEQRAQFKKYSADEQDIRETIAARHLSGDPSGGPYTPEQTAWVKETFGDPAAQAEVQRRAAETERQRVDPTTYLGGARAPEPTRAERAIGWAGQRVGVPLLMAGRAIPGGELGYQAMRRFAPEHARAAAGAVEESLAATPTVPKWVPGLGGWQPVRTATQIAPYVLGGAAGAAGGGIPAGLMTVGAGQAGARGIGRGMAPLDVAATAATGALEMGVIGGAFQVGGKLTPRGKWWRSLTPTQQAQRVMGLPAGPPPPPGAMKMLGEKAGRVAAKPMERAIIGAARRGYPRVSRELAFLRGKMAPDLPPQLPKFYIDLREALRGPVKPPPFKAAGLLPSGIGEAGTMQLPSRKVIQSRLQSLGVDALKAAGYAARIAKALGPAGGDIFKAAIAVGVQEGLARKLAEAFGRGIEAAPTSDQAARVQPAPPAPAEAAKEAWEMTRAEAYQAGPPSETKPPLGNVWNQSTLAMWHEVEVETALREGKPVPPAVLADYPDLAKLEAAPKAPAGAAPKVAPNATKAAEVQARKLGIDLATVRGTGRKGQILRKDVQNVEKIREIRAASERVGAPLRPGTIIEQTRQALEDEGLPTRMEGPGLPQEPRPAADGAEAEKGEIAPPRGGETPSRPQKPPVTAARRVPLAPTGGEQPSAGQEPAFAEATPGQEEAVPLEVLAAGAPRAAPTVHAFDRMTPDELVRMLKKIPGPYGKTVADTQEVGQAVKALRQAQKNRKVAEAAAKEYLKTMRSAYPDAIEGAEGVSAVPLLEWLKGDKINAWMGLQAAPEIREMLEGRPDLAKYFVRKQPKVKPPQGYLDQVTESAMKDPDSGFRGETTSAFLDQMVAESGKAAAPGAGKVSTEESLRRLAQDIPEEAGAELVERADALASETNAVEAAREKVLASAEPYLAVGREPSEVEVVEVEAGQAVKRIAGLRRQLEDLRTRAMGEQTLSQALREDVIKVARTMARRFPELGPKFLTEKLAAVDSPKQAEALIDWMQKHAAVAERRAVRLGVEKRMARMRKTVGALEEPYHTRVREALDAFDPARPRERTVRGIESTIAFVDEHPGLEPLLPPKRLRDLARLAKKPLADLDLTELRDLDGYFEMWERLAETKGRLKIGQHLRDYFADVDEGEAQILASGRDVPAHRRAEGTWRRILKRGVLDAGTISRDLGGASDPVDRALDAEAAAAKDSQATRYLARNLWEGERDAKKHLASFLKHTFEACGAADLPFGSKAMIAAMEERVTVELPTATDMAGRKRVGRVTMSAAELAETVLDYEDPNTVRQAALAGDCWQMPRTKDLARPGPTDPKIRLGVQDVAALRDALAARPKVQQLAYALHEIYNDPATFRAMDDAVFELDMRHLIKEGPYHPRSRNWQLEGPPRVPEAYSDMRDVFLEHLGPAQARTGTSAAVVHGNLFSKAMNHFTVVSRIVGMARAVRGAWMFLDSKAIKRAMINRHGTGLPDFYKAVIRNLMGTGITQPSTTEAIAKEMMHRFAVAALGLRVQTGLRQVWSTWNTADVLGADAVALGYKNFLSHRKESLDELMAASPIAWLRLHYYGGTDALLSGPSATIERQYGKKTLGERSLVLVRMGDGVGVGALWEACKAWGAKHGVTDTETLGRLWEDLLNEEGAGPTTGETYQSLLATEARRSVLARIGTFFGNFRNRIVNKIWKRVIDVRNRPGDGEAWKRLWRALVVVLLGTTVPMVAIGAGYRWFSSGGKRKPTGTSLALDAVENSVGNVYLLGDAFYAGRRVLERGTVYGAGARQNPLARVVTSWIQGAGGVYLGVDQAISGERYKAGTRRGQRRAPRTLGRAASALLEAVGYSLGLPVAPLAYWRGALRFAEGEGVAGEKKEGADAEALAWKASGEGAGAAEAVEKLKAAGVTYIEARRALRAAMVARGDRSAKAWFERGAALRKAWFAARQAA